MSQTPKFLIHNFEKIFVFLEQHPQKVNLRRQLVTYLLSASHLKAQEVEELLEYISSPILKKEAKMHEIGFIEEAYLRGVADNSKKEREVAAQEKTAAVRLNTRTLIMRGWKKGTPADLITDLTGLPQTEIEKLLAGFEQGKTYFESKTRANLKKMRAITGLNAEELDVFIKILKEK